MPDRKHWLLGQNGLYKKSLTIFAKILFYVLNLMRLQGHEKVKIDELLIYRKRVLRMVTN